MVTVAIQVAASVIGGLVASLLAPAPPDVIGPRLNDLNVPGVSPGAPMPWVLGTMKVPGFVIWTSGLIETRNVDRVGGKGGGKSTRNITYTYSAHLAVGVCEGPVSDFFRVLGNNKVIWDSGILDTLTGPEIDALVATFEADYYAAKYATYLGHYSAGTAATLATRATELASEDYRASLESYADDIPLRYDRITFQTGTSSQTPDTLMEEFLGAGNVPAYRDTAYFVIKNLQLADFGQAIPSFQVQVGSSETLNPFDGVIRASGGSEEEPIPHFEPATALVEAWYDAKADNPTLDGVSIYKTEDTVVSGPVTFDAGLDGYYLSMENSGTSSSDDALIMIIDIADYLESGYDYTALELRASFDVGRSGVLAANIQTFTVSAANDVRTMSNSGGVNWPAKAGMTTLYNQQPSWTPSGGVTDIEPWESHISGWVSVPVGKKHIMVHLEGLRADLWREVQIELRGEVFLENPLTVTNVGEIHQQILTRAGLVLDTDFTVDASLYLLEVPGFADTRASAPRDLIETLQMVYPVDVSEQEFIIRVANRDKTLSGEVLRTDLRTAESGTDQDNWLEEVVILDDISLPKKVQFSFQDIRRSYSVNSVTANRQSTESMSSEEYSFTICETETSMKEAVWRYMAYLLSEKFPKSLKLPFKYIVYEPGDVVYLPDALDGYARQMRIKEMNIGANYLIEVKAVDHVTSLGGEVSSEIDSYTPPTYEADGAARTVTYLLDTPYLTDEKEDDDAGIYAVFGQLSTTWAGAVLYWDAASGGSVPAFGGSIGAGSGSYIVVGSSSNSTQGGELGLALAEASPYMRDDVNELLVIFETQLPLFSTYSEEDIQFTVDNVFLVGDEILQAEEATQIDAQTWVFTKLYRGMQGTEWAINGQVAGTRVVQLDRDAVFRVPMSTTDIDVALTFRGVSVGQDVQAQLDVLLTYEGNDLKPYAPTVMDVTRATDGAVTVILAPRARYNGDLLSGEGNESDQVDIDYEIDVLDAPGGVLLRTISLSATETFTYSAAQQVTDFGSVQATIDVVTYQIGAIVGRGFPGVEVI